ncbi:MAG TPA: DUF5679 domain-containing protein [Roseiflexaceae bacterium]|nr:DUF5679 domain-containing protein [Roseiflexaceae bacterium]
MLKRLFGLLAFALLGWLVWRWWQERTEDLFIAGPQLAPTVLPPERPDHALPVPADELTQPVAETPVAVEPVREEAVAAPEESAEPEAGEEEGEEESGEEDDAITGYCVRCRAKRQMQNAHVETTENGRRGARGTCPVCGSTMFRFLKEVKVED